MEIASHATAHVATIGRRTNVRSSELRYGGKFGVVARALWPRKTAAEIAAKTGVTQRAAEHWLAGTRRPSAMAVAAVVAEILD